jgi:Flp pilus assembly protein TadD
MGADKLLAGCLLILMAGVGSFAQGGSSPSGQASSQSSSTAAPAADSHRSGHHIQVPVEDSPAQPVKLTEAENAIEKGDYAAAEPLLRKVVEEDPTNYVAWFDLGFVENALEKLDDSIAAYRKSVAAKPDVFESNLNLGLQLAKTGQADAEKYLLAATNLKPTSHPAEGRYRAWISLAQTIAKSKPEEALADYEHAATLQPREAEPHLLAGRVLEQENKFAEAEQEYKQALALDARSSDAVTGLANIYMRGRRFPEAEEYLRKMLAAHADLAAVHIQLGRVLAAEGKTDAAIDELEAGTKLAPGDDAAQRDLAELYATAGKNDLAEAAYRGLLIAHPSEAELHRRLGQALLRQKKFPEAQQEFLTTVKLKPDLGEAYGDLAFAAGENKDYALVIRALDARAKVLPEIPITYFLRASAYDHLHDPKMAAANYHLFLNSAKGKYPDQEWQATHRLIAIEPKK